jgi:hypothetical protein
MVQAALKVWRLLPLEDCQFDTSSKANQYLFGSVKIC